MDMDRQIKRRKKKKNLNPVPNLFCSQQEGDRLTPGQARARDGNDCHPNTEITLDSSNLTSNIVAIKIMIGVITTQGGSLIKVVAVK